MGAKTIPGVLSTVTVYDPMNLDNWELSERNGFLMLMSRGREACPTVASPSSVRTDFYILLSFPSLLVSSASVLLAVLV